MHDSGSSLKSILIECSAERSYAEVCNRFRGVRYDPGALERLARAIRTKPGRLLRSDDVEAIFSKKNAHYGHYWSKLPDLRLKEAALSLLECERGKSLSDLNNWRKNRVRALFEVAKSMEVTSVILQTIYPDDFGVYSPPVLTFLQIALRPPVDHYLAYCDELREWSAHFLNCESAARMDRALWVFYELAYGSEPKESVAAQYREAFARDTWVRQARARNVLGMFFRESSPLQQAEFLIGVDHNLAGKIAGCEFEVRLRASVPEADFNLWRQGRTGLKGELVDLVEYVAEKANSGLRKHELHKARVLRNQAIHGKKLTKSDVEKMIALTRALSQRARS